MSAHSFAKEMRSLVVELQEEGHSAIACTNLIAYLDSIVEAPEEEPSSVQLERYRAHLQRWVAESSEEHQRSSRS